MSVDINNSKVLKENALLRKGALVNLTKDTQMAYEETRTQFTQIIQSLKNSENIPQKDWNNFQDNVNNLKQLHNNLKEQINQMQGDEMKKAKAMFLYDTSFDKVINFATNLSSFLNKNLTNFSALIESKHEKNSNEIVITNTARDLTLAYRKGEMSQEPLENIKNAFILAYDNYKNILLNDNKKELINSFIDDIKSAKTKGDLDNAHSKYVSACKELKPTQSHHTATNRPAKTVSREMQR